MARVLFQLKLRLLINALRSSRRARISFLISTAFAVLVAAGTFVILALLRGQSAPVTQTAAVFTVFAFGWLILPIMSFGLDGTLDPATLAMYPLRTRPLAVGLLAASATGAWPVANVIGLLGVTIGLARGAFGEVVALVAVVLQVLFCIALARFVTTSLAGLLRSRRGKDFAAFLVVPLFALYELFAQVVPRLAAEGKITANTFAGIDRWLRWLPPGLAAHAIQDASAGHPGAALLRLVLLAAVVVVLGALWILSLSRALVTVDTTTQSSAVRGAPLPFARGGIRGTVAGRFLLYQRRDPVSIVRWCIIAVVMGAAAVGSLRTPHYAVGLVLSSVLGAGMVSLLHANSIGFTGPSFWLEASALTSDRDLRSYLSGRNVALAVIAVPLMLIASVLLAVASGHPMYGILAVAIDLAAIGAALALSSIFTVSLAYPGQKRVGSPVPGNADGYSGQAVGCSLGSIIGVAVLTLPVTVLMLATDSVSAAVRVPVLAGWALVYGIGLAWGGTRIAAATARGRVPELNQIAAQSTF
jgi:ABC-2 type transport system permease protein